MLKPNRHGKDRTHKTSPSIKTEMNGQDKKDLIKTLGQIDTSQPGKIMAKLKKSNRFFQSELGTERGTVKLVSTSGFEGTHTFANLAGMLVN